MEFDFIQVIVKGINQGTSKAVCTGIRASRGSVLLLLDADLVDLSADRLTDLITPVTQGQADFSTTLRGNALLPWRWLGLDYVSGERILHRELIAGSLEDIESLPGFGLEVYMNKLVTKLGSRSKVVPWDEVRSPHKSAKYGFRCSIDILIRIKAMLLTFVLTQIKHSVNPAAEAKLRHSSIS